MRKYGWLFVFCLFFAFAYVSQLHAGEIYTWTDKEGTIHITDNPVDMPFPKAVKGSTDFPPRSPQSRKGWTRVNLTAAIEGCVLGMLHPNIESYKRRAAQNGHQVSAEEIEKVGSRLRQIFLKTCECTLGELSKRWDYEVYLTKPTAFYDEFLKYLLEEKICSLPIPPG